MTLSVTFNVNQFETCEINLITLCRSLTGLSCVCLGSFPNPRYLGPAVSCDLLCQDMPCGGKSNFSDVSFIYYSVYCVDSDKGLMGIPLAYPNRWAPSRPHTGSHSTLLKQMTSLNTASLVIAGLLALILVFLMIVLVFLYFQKQESKMKQI